MAQPSPQLSGRELVDRLLSAAKRSTQAAQDAQDAAQRLAAGQTASEPIPPALASQGSQGRPNQ